MIAPRATAPYAATAISGRSASVLVWVISPDALDGLSRGQLILASVFGGPVDRPHASQQIDEMKRRLSALSILGLPVGERPPSTGKSPRDSSTLVSMPAAEAMGD